jgi:cation:H+ antiporter
VTEALEEGGSEGVGRGLLLALVGIGVMTAGGSLAVAGAERVAEALEITDSAVGLTFVALATTAELLALVGAAARRGLDELAVAGVLGSAVYNATVTLGVAALARPLATGGTGGAAVAAAAIPLALLVLSGAQVSSHAFPAPFS